MFYGAFFMSNTGNMIQTVALTWLLFKLTDSSLSVGMLFFIKQLMMFLLSPIAGTMADARNRKQLLIITSVCSGVLGLILAAITLHGSITATLLFVYVGLEGVFMGIDMTTRQAFLKDLVRGKSFIRNAIALNSLLFNIARITGPVLGGIIIESYGNKQGEAFCFLLNGLSFFMVSIVLLRMKNIRFIRQNNRPPAHVQLRQGFSYTMRHPVIGTLITFTALLGFFGFPVNVILPEFSKNILLGDAKLLGLLTTSMGVGAVCSGLLLASRKQFNTYQKFMMSGPVLYGLAIVSMAWVTSSSAAIISMFFIGAGQSLVFTSSNSIIQTLAATNMVGRTVSLYIMLFMGATTLGSIFAGQVAETLGAPNTLVLCGLGCFAAYFFYVIRYRYQHKKHMIKTSQGVVLPG